jgi:hypothetical protein
MLLISSHNGSFFRALGPMWVLDLPVMTEQKVRPQQDQSVRLEVTLAKNFNKEKLQG